MGALRIYLVVDDEEEKKKACCKWQKKTPAVQIPNIGDIQEGISRGLKL